MNLPGLLYLSAMALFCFQTVPATWGSVSSLMGSPLGDRARQKLEDLLDLCRRPRPSASRRSEAC